MLFLLLPSASADTFVYPVCACSRTHGASSRELGERHSSCGILLSMLIQPAAAAVCFYVLPPLLLLLQLLLLLLLSVVVDC